MRPYVTLSCAVSIDGYIDDNSPERLLLSNAEDFDRVDQVRAENDAILIGASTMRKDNPRLLVNSEARRADRVAKGLPAYPLKVTITASGDLDPNLKFWHHGDAKLVYCPEPIVPQLRKALNGLAEVTSTGPTVDLGAMLDDLATRGVRRLMVEGGGTIHTQFLTQSLADEIHLAIAPIFVGQADAPRFLYPGNFPGGPDHRIDLIEARTVGDVALLRFRPRTSPKPAAE